MPSFQKFLFKSFYLKTIPVHFKALLAIRTIPGQGWSCSPLVNSCEVNSFVCLNEVPLRSSLCVILVCVSRIQLQSQSISCEYNCTQL